MNKEEYDPLFNEFYLRDFPWLSDNEREELKNEIIKKERNIKLNEIIKK